MISSGSDDVIKSVGGSHFVEFGAYKAEARSVKGFSNMFLGGDFGVIQILLS